MKKFNKNEFHFCAEHQIKWNEIFVHISWILYYVKIVHSGSIEVNFSRVQYITDASVCQRALLLCEKLEGQNAGVSWKFLFDWRLRRNSLTK